jgi:hypothetical protein
VHAPRAALQWGLSQQSSFHTVNQGCEKSARLATVGGLVRSNADSAADLGPWLYRCALLVVTLDVTGGNGAPFMSTLYYVMLCAPFAVALDHSGLASLRRAVAGVVGDRL